MAELYIGALSGTSADAVDAAVFDFEHPQLPVLCSHHSESLPAVFKTAITEFQSGTLSAYQMTQLDFELGQLFARVIKAAVTKAKLDAGDIIAIGSHGQTLAHKPNETPAFSLQIGNPNIIAADTRIPTVADFRNADIALGGQGAPLSAAFHQACFSKTGENRIIINIGGICNVSFLGSDSSIAAFDCGPGNTLLDCWARQHLNTPYDDRGEWAATKPYDSDLLAMLRNNPFLNDKPLKSACTSDFSERWLQNTITAWGHPNPDAAVVQSTLTELTAISIAAAVADYALPLARIFVCGGGTNNVFLMQRIQHYLNCPLLTTEALGITPQWVEAAAFAWLAQQTLENKPANIPAVTGASSTAVLGAVYASNRIR